MVAAAAAAAAAEARQVGPVLELRIEGLLPVVDGHPPAREPLHQHVPPWRVSWHLGSMNASFWGARLFFDDMGMVFSIIVHIL